MFKKRLLELCNSSKKWIAMTVLMNWISIICNILVILFIGNTIDKLINSNLEINYLRDGLYIRSLLVIRFLANYYSTRFSLNSSSEVKKVLREKIYEKLLDIGVNYNKFISTSSVVQIGVDGVEALEIYFGRFLPQLFYSALAPLTLFVVVSFISFKVALVLLICVPLIPLTIMAVMKIAKKLLSKYWGVYTNLGDSFLENLQGLTTLKIFDLDEEKNKEMNEDAENFRKITMRVLLMQLNSITIMDLVAYGGSAVGILIAISQFRSGIITPGGLLIIILLSAEFFLPMRLLGSLFHVAMNGISASDRIFDLLDIEVEEKPSLSDEQMKSLDNIDIKLENVSYSYDKKRTILENINIDIKEKQTVAFVGESGSGKSTITSLLLKIDEVDKGAITFNGINLNDIPFDVLNKKVGFINHNAYIFNTTIRENIKMGKKDATDEEIYAVLKEANLDSFVKNLPNKLDTKVGEGGNLLSGGQKQRLCLARTIIKNPDIYIFDEATSNIDVESEEKIWESIEKLSKDKTVIIISHRLLNVKNADTIYMLENGVIAESGNHNELMLKGGVYKNLVDHQNDLENIYDELESKNLEKVSEEIEVI
ncbi:ABC transporter ATP-binding protein/permease [Intestinibacter bartlettii]|uniref:ABC transporter ATP-binding protein/permease n=1 Tax=Intestinibacter bartlettii TaxID=261299 RepID=UPI001D11C9D9|nr:ABC transporter ATP-binding protein/permease [Intestinibacter bartlettii]MCC2705819.1 ABC transporter ATP-binding protein/permease [Intestinibacter bartlettii]MCC2761269.1 ABC transporter ATP-binding protein/permease [Intestinibacter bartlettii]